MVADNRSGGLGGDRSSGWLSCPLQGLSSPPPLSRTPVSFLTYRAGSPRAQALRQEIEVMLAKGALEIARDPGPGFYSRLFLVEKASGALETRDRSLTPERLHPADVVQDGNSRFCTVICQRGGLSSSPGSEGCVLSDPDPSIFEEAIEVHVGGDGLPVLSFVLRSVDRSPGLYQSLRGRVSVGTLPRDQTSPVSGRLVGSLLLGAGSQTGRPVPSLALSHPRDCDKREEVRSRSLAVCEISGYDHRYRGWQGFSVSAASREIPDGSGELLCYGLSPSSALAGDSWSPGFARVAGSSRSSSDALSAVASEDALVSRVKPSLSSGGFATGGETGSVLVDGEGPSLGGGLIRDTGAGSSPVFGRVLLGGGALTSSINACPGFGPARRSCSTSIFSR